MKAAPTASFVVAQPEFLLRFLVIPFDDPAMFGHVHQFPKIDVSVQSGQPVLGWLRFRGGPFDQQPFFRVRFRSPLVTMRGAHPDSRKAGLQFLLHPLSPSDLLPGLGGQ